MTTRRRSSVKKSLHTLARAFAEIERSLQQLSMRVRRAAREAARRRAMPARRRAMPARRGRTLRITPERRAQLKLQGAYMGYMRQLGPRQKARVKAVKEQKGFKAAIAAAKTLAMK